VKSLAKMLPSLLIFGNPEFTPEKLPASGQDTSQIAISDKGKNMIKHQLTRKQRMPRRKPPQLQFLKVS
jgi:hypothetical protein